jgi:hypothetical protein
VQVDDRRQSAVRLGPIRTDGHPRRDGVAHVGQLGGLAEQRDRVAHQPAPLVGGERVERRMVGRQL